MASQKPVPISLQLAVVRGTRCIAVESELSESWARVDTSSALPAFCRLAHEQTLVRFRASLRTPYCDGGGDGFE